MIKDLSPEIIKANRSARSKGAVGQNAIIPKLVSEMFSKDISILDYGCGPNRIHSDKLKQDGFKVDSFDFGKNWREGMQYEVFPNKYDLIYASNVVNTWGNIKMVCDSLEQIRNGLKEDGVFLANFPKKPRYIPTMKDDDFELILANAYFSTVKMIQANVWYCRK